MSTRNPIDPSTTIHHAQYAEYKDLGVDWLDEIPAEWGAARLKFFTDVQSGIARGKTHDGDRIHRTSLSTRCERAGWLSEPGRYLRD